MRQLFGDRVETLRMTRRHYVEKAASPHDYRELFKETFGPVVAIYASLAKEPERAAAIDRDFLEFATRADSGPPEGPRSTATSTCSWSRVGASRRGEVKEVSSAKGEHGRGERRRS